VSGRVETRVAATLALLLAASATWLAAAPRRTLDEQRFPHARHNGLFPTCLGCHSGVLADSLATFPSPQQCSGCHDGRQQKVVTWTGPAVRPTNLRFSHVRHNTAADLGQAELNCRRCHAQVGDTVFMAVQRAVPALCVGCHSRHQATTHLANESPCRTCHVPLVQAVALVDSTIWRFPRPASHDRADFISNHAPSMEEAQARCSVCHSRESCARCHMDAGRVPAIAALGSDPRVMRLAAGRAASYPTPPSHQRADWTYAHGKDARARIESCATCHAQPSCRACHIGSMSSDLIKQLPQDRPDGPHGVQLRGWNPGWPTSMQNGAARVSPASLVARAPSVGVSGASYSSGARDTSPVKDTARTVRVHPPGFATSHNAAAATRQATCTGCHERRFCSSCHDGEAANQRRFHPPNFVERHPTDAYRRQRDCSTCHNPEVFCRGCHQGLGLKSQGRLEVAFHTAQPLWLLQHGRAARQGMESCTSCHAQRDCMRCHSELGWGVNPHGSSFDAARMQKKNPITCRYCHVGDPLANR
jgi:predicted CXXCH cytochrome family protein